MQELYKFYINGAWVEPQETLRPHDVIDPSTEAVVARIALGSAADVDSAVKAARAAFPAFSQTTVAERSALIERVIEEYMKRYADIAAAISTEMGAPAGLAKTAQAGIGVAHLQTALAVLKSYAFEEMRGTTLLRKEPIGVCGFITPWNWPTNQVMCKVAPALATGCTMVLKPSEMAPLSAQILAEVLDAAGVRFNENRFGLDVLAGKNPFAVTDDASLQRYIDIVFHREQAKPWVPWPASSGFINKRKRDAAFEQAVLDRIGRGPEQFAPGNEAAKIHQPVLLLWGRQDAVIDPSAMALFAAKMPQARQELVDDAGHMSLMEQPDAVADAVAQLIDSD